MNIALFGGSFDPPHFAHEMIVKLALKNFNIDKLIIMPTFLNPFKDEFAANAQIRLNWITKIFKIFDKVEVCDFEVKQNRPVATIESVKYIKTIYNVKTFYLIIGADNFKNIHKWKNFDELIKEVEFIVVLRDSIELPKEVKKIFLNEKISSTYIRNKEDYDKISPLIKDEVKEFYSNLKFKEKIWARI